MQDTTKEGWGFLFSLYLMGAIIALFIILLIIILTIVINCDRSYPRFGQASCFIA
jgi:hypothetical protein